MKPVLWVALALGVLIAGFIAGGAVYLIQPLGPGQNPTQVRHLDVNAADWRNVRGWHLGVSQIDLMIKPAGGGPCIVMPWARIVQVGPVTITY